MQCLSQKFQNKIYVNNLQKLAHYPFQLRNLTFYFIFSRFYHLFYSPYNPSGIIVSAYLYNILGAIKSGVQRVREPQLSGENCALLLQCITDPLRISPSLFCDNPYGRIELEILFFIQLTQLILRVGSTRKVGLLAHEICCFFLIGHGLQWRKMCRVSKL